MPSFLTPEDEARYNQLQALMGQGPTAVSSPTQVVDNVQPISVSATAAPIAPDPDQEIRDAVRQRTIERIRSGGVMPDSPELIQARQQMTAAMTPTQTQPDFDQGGKGILERLAYGAAQGSRGIAYPGGYAALHAQEQSQAAAADAQRLARAKELYTAADQQQKERAAGQRDVTTEGADYLKDIEAQRARAAQEETNRITAGKAAEEVRHNKAMEPRRDLIVVGNTVIDSSGNVVYKGEGGDDKTPLDRQEYDLRNKIAGLPSSDPQRKDLESKLQRIVTTRTEVPIAGAVTRGEEARKTGVASDAVREVSKHWDAKKAAEETMSDAQNAYDRITQNKTSSPGSDDLKILFGYMQSTVGAVRGGRMTMAEIQAEINALPLTDRIRMMYERAKSGKQLDPGQRNEMMNVIKSRVGSATQTYQDAVNDYGWEPSGAARERKQREAGGNAAPAARGAGIAKPGGAVEALIKNIQGGARGGH